MLKDKVIDKPKRTELKKEVKKEIKPVKKAVKKNDNLYVFNNIPENGSVVLGKDIVVEIKNGSIELSNKLYNKIKKDVKESMNIRKA